MQAGSMLLRERSRQGGREQLRLAGTRRQQCVAVMHDQRAVVIVLTHG